ncbi:MAG: glycosyltransferase, partial [Acidobacteriota bacterium]
MTELSRPPADPSRAPASAHDAGANAAPPMPDDLRIGVVAYEMEGARTGVGRYLEGLLHGLTETDCPWRWTLFFKGPEVEHALWDDPRIEPVFDDRADARPILWEQIRLPRLMQRHALDVVFSPAYSLPARPEQPSLVTIHDLSFERRASEFSLRERYRRRFLARRAARQATRVLAGTEHIAHELQTTYGLPPEKLGIVPLAVDDDFQPVKGPGDRQALAAHGI